MRNYQRIVVTVMLLVLAPAGLSHAGDGVTRFYGELVRKSGKPVLEVREFQATAGPATLKLYNGSGRCSWAKRVSSAWVSVNGVRVFCPSKVNERVGYLKATVNLKDGCNVLKVFLTGKTGSKIRIKITQQIEACGPTRISVASDGTQGNSHSLVRSISADGRFVAFTSEAWNLVPGDTNESEDVFVYDRRTGVTERVSVASGGTEAKGMSLGPSISADGRFVAFWSDASNLVPGDTNAVIDVFVHDRQTRVTERVNVASDGTEANGGTSVLWRGGPSINGDGRFVAFVSNASNLVPGVVDEFGRGIVYVHDRKTGATEVVSVENDTGEPFGFGSNRPSISADGRFVAFDAGTLDRQLDVYVYDRQTGVTELITGDADLWDESLSPSISADGRYVAFHSNSPNLVPDDTNGVYDIFVHDRQTGVTERVSVASDGTQSDNHTDEAWITGDGRFVAFWSDASNLVPGDTNGNNDVFVHDRQTGVTERVSVASDGSQGDSGNGPISISSDGRFVAFESSSSNLVPGDTNEAADVFVACNPLSEQQFIEIEIDIKPGRFPNRINPKSRDPIPVAILTTDAFDAATVDLTTVHFGPTGTEAAPVHSILADVDGDGDADILLHFKTRDTHIEWGDTSASLTGETFSGRAIKGSDSIRTVWCKHHWSHHCKHHHHKKVK